MTPKECIKKHASSLLKILTRADEINEFITTISNILHRYCKCGDRMEMEKIKTDTTQYCNKCDLVYSYDNNGELLGIKEWSEV
jgi:hypothetical protein